MRISRSGGTNSVTGIDRTGARHTSNPLNFYHLTFLMFICGFLLTKAFFYGTIKTRIPHKYKRRLPVIRINTDVPAVFSAYIYIIPHKCEFINIKFIKVKLIAVQISSLILVILCKKEYRMFYDRLKQICRSHGTSVTRMCLDLGLSSANTSNWKSGRLPSYTTLLKLADYLNIPVDDLVSGGEERRTEGKGVRIPVVGLIRAGVPAEAVEDVVDFEEITDELAAKGEYMALRVAGDSMEPRICEGDVVIVRRQPDAETGDVCAVMIGGSETTLKKIQRTEGGVMLIPFNPAYPTMFFTNKQIERLPVVFLGKVIENRQEF